MFRSGNPVLGERAVKQAHEAWQGTGTMTVSGAVNKSLILFLTLLIGASFTWYIPTQEAQGWMIFGAIGGFVLAMVTIFKMEWASYTAPAYALLEGLFLGGISAVYQQAYGGIVMNAILLTMGILGAMLIAYRSGLIKVNERFRTGVIAATGGVVLVYFLSFILQFFGIQVGLVYGNGLMSIGFSLIVIVIAAMNLALDFDFFVEGEKNDLPSYMEWYAAFGLMVTLVWLYLEILRLLAKMQSRD
ncbi:MAG: Bax inhibitor-1/YccA family protein [Bacteroidota bacterium]